MPQRVLICGGGGFVGTVLTQRLLSLGHEVRVLDTFWFGDFLAPHDRLTKIRGDMRDGGLVDRAVAGVDAVIQLACLSNDPTSDLDADLTRAINYDACADVIHRAKANGVRRFIYASSASVYGVRDEPDITEQMELAPITLYSQYKADIEQVLFDAGSERFTTVAVRNSTVCGVSPRMRLDLIISIFVMVAMKKGLITIEGGTQLRPLIHMEDLVDLYVLLLDAGHQPDRSAGLQHQQRELPGDGRRAHGSGENPLPARVRVVYRSALLPCQHRQGAGTCSATPPTVRSRRRSTKSRKRSASR